MARPEVGDPSEREGRADLDSRAEDEAQPEEGDKRAKREARTLEARAALTPLGPEERPLALLVAVAVASAVAVLVLGGALTIHDLARHGGSLPGAVFLALVLGLLAQGMYRRRYWAVLGFEGLLAFQILVTSLALVVASTIVAAALCLLGIVLAGWLFWKLVRVMGRIQVQDRR